MGQDSRVARDSERILGFRVGFHVRMDSGREARDSWGVTGGVEGAWGLEDPGIFTNGRRSHTFQGIREVKAGWRKAASGRDEHRPGDFREGFF